MSGLRTAVVIVAMCVSAPALAADGVFVYPNENAKQLGLDDESVRLQVGAAIGSALHVGDQLPFLTAMSTAADLSMAGMGGNYATDFDRYLVGFSLGSASVLSQSEEGSSVSTAYSEGDAVAGGVLPEDGQAIHATLLVGVNLGVWMPRHGWAQRVSLLANVLQADVPTPDVTYSANATTLGLHGQVQVIKPRQSGMARWGGVDVTTGVRLGRYRMKMAEELPVEVDAGLIIITWRSVGKYDVTATNFTVPMEISTSASIGPLALFVGGAVDAAVLSYATSEASMSGNIVARYLNSNQEIHLGEASVVLSNSANGRVMTPRVFGGAALTTDPATVLAHINYAPSGGIGGHVGMRVAF